MFPITKNPVTRLFSRSILAVAVSMAATGCSLIQPVPDSTLSSATRSALPTAEIPFSKFKLDNGLTVIVHEDRKSPVVAVNVWYKVGSKDEQPGKTGFAHLFEHLMFNGSENYKDDFFVPFLKAGATDMNGTTNSDRTNYFETVPTSALDMALWMESDRMGHFLGALSQATLDEQRGVVKNEKRQGENGPYGKSWEYIVKDTFPVGHPYSWTTIGSMEDLDAASLDDVKQWFKTYYGPSNAVIVLAGDIDEKTAREKVSHYFGDIPPGPPLAVQESWVAKLKEDKRRIIEDRVKQTRIVKIWNTPQTGTQEEQDLELLAYVLGNGKNSRLYKRLVQQDKLATSADAWVYSRKLAGQFGVSVDLKPGADSHKVEAAIQEEINKLLKDGPSRKELQQARFKFLANFVMDTERIGGFGGKSDVLAWGEVYHNDPGYYQKTEAMLIKATPASVKATANEWLSGSVYTQITTPYPEYSASSQHADRSKVPPVGDVQTPILPELKRATLSNGMKVVILEREHAPLVNIRLQFEAGRASHQQYGEGIPYFTLAMLEEGTQSRTAQEIQSELDSLGAELSAGVNYDLSAIDISTLTVSLVDSIELLQDIVMNPAFKNSDIEHLRSQGLDQIAMETTVPSYMIDRELSRKLYGEQHPYSSPATGSGNKQTIENLTREQVVNYYHEWLRPDNATLIVVGDTRMDTLLPILEKAFQKWKAPASPKPVIQYPEIKQPQQTTIYLIDQPDAQQSTIAAAQLIPEQSANTAEELSFDIFNDLLGGTFTSRINMNLREDKHWSYGARSYSLSTSKERPFIVQTSVQTDKTAAAMSEIKKELDEVTSKVPATLKEVTTNQENRLKELSGLYETNASLLHSVSDMIANHQPDNYLQQYPEYIKGVSMESVRQVGKKRLKPNQMVWMVVGDLKIIEPQIRALKLGSLKIIKLE